MDGGGFCVPKRIGIGNVEQSLGYITVNPTKFSDKKAELHVLRKGTGYVLEYRVYGARGGVRTEQMGLTASQGRHLSALLREGGV